MLQLEYSQEPAQPAEPTEPAEPQAGPPRPSDPLPQASEKARWSNVGWTSVKRAHERQRKNLIFQPIDFKPSLIDVESQASVLVQSTCNNRALPYKRRVSISFATPLTHRPIHSSFLFYPASFPSTLHTPLGRRHIQPSFLYPLLHHHYLDQLHSPHPFIETTSTSLSPTLCTSPNLFRLFSCPLLDLHNLDQIYPRQIHHLGILTSSTSQTSSTRLISINFAYTT